VMRRRCWRLPSTGTSGTVGASEACPGGGRISVHGRDENRLHNVRERASGVDDERPELAVSTRLTSIPSQRGGQLLRVLSELVRSSHRQAMPERLIVNDEAHSGIEVVPDLELVFGGAARNVTSDADAVASASTRPTSILQANSSSHPSGTGYGGWMMTSCVWRCTQWEKPSQSASMAR
jgi:hypothetical protein